MITVSEGHPSQVEYFKVPEAKLVLPMDRIRFFPLHGSLPDDWEAPFTDYNTFSETFPLEIHSLLLKMMRWEL